MVICPECKKSGYEIEIIALETYGGKDKHILNVEDQSEHVHLFNEAGWSWEHYADIGETAKWDNPRGKVHVT
jgi:hypothetical protein